jgi:DNA-binding IclR family transcriptional regulator
VSAVSAETAQTLDRGLRLLSILAGEERGLSVTELATRLAVSRPAVYRLLATLEQHALVSRGPGGLTRLGLGLLPLARAVTPFVGEVAMPLLRRLAEDAAATAHLTVAEPGPGGATEAVAVAVVEPSHTNMHVAYRIGTRHSLERGAAGRAILAARNGGGDFVVTEGELQAGATGIAAPVLGVAGLEASVGLIAIGSGLDPVRVGPQVVATAAAIAAAVAAISGLPRP